MTKSEVKSKLDDAKHAAQDVSKAAVDLARETASTVKDEAKTLVEKTAKQVQDVAAERIDTARESVADAGSRLAETLQDNAKDAYGIGAQALSGAADGLTSAAKALRSQSLEDLIGRTKDLAKRHPGAFAVGAAVAGFAVARFLRSSSRALEAERRAEAQTERVYRDASRRAVDTMGQTGRGSDGSRS